MVAKNTMALWIIIGISVAHKVLKCAEFAREKLVSIADLKLIRVNPSRVSVVMQFAHPGTSEKLSTSFRQKASCNCLRDQSWLRYVDCLQRQPNFSAESWCSVSPQFLEERIQHSNVHVLIR